MMNFIKIVIAFCFLFISNENFPQNLQIDREIQIFSYIFDIEYSPDSQFFYTAGGTYFRQLNELKQWNRDFTLFTFYEGGMYPFYQIRFFENSHYFVTLGGMDNDHLREFILWSDTVDTPIRRLKYQKPAVRNFQCLDTTILINTKNSIREINPFKDIEYTISYTGIKEIFQIETNKKFVFASRSDSSLIIWNKNKKQSKDSLKFENQIVTFKIIKDTCISVLRNGKIIKLNLQSKENQDVSTISVKYLDFVTISHTGRFIAYSDNQTITVLDLWSNKIFAQHNFANKLVTTIAFSPDDNYLLYALTDSKIRVLKL